MEHDTTAPIPSLPSRHSGEGRNPGSSQAPSAELVTSLGSGLRRNDGKAKDSAQLDTVIAPYLDQRGALLPILHAVQAAFGHVADDAVPVIAAALNLSRADVHGVLTFYHDFRRAPAGRHVLKLCSAEACQSMGGAALQDHAIRRLRTPMHSARSDGAVTLEPVYCLGLCSAAPAAMLDGQVVARLTPKRLDALLDGIAA